MSNFLRTRAKTMLVPAAVFALAACGFWSQVRHNFRLPFPLNILFFPIRVLEFMLRVTIGAMSTTKV